MTAINYYNPTRFIFKKGCVAENAPLLASFGKKALIVTGRRSAKACGALDDVTAALLSQGVKYVLFDEAINNPTIQVVQKGMQRCREEHADFVIGIGGGSPMDTAKAIAFLVHQSLSEDDYFNQSLYQNVGLPTVMIPTTSGTGSEVTQYAVLMNDKTRSKSSISTPWIFPKLALLDPSYTNFVNLENTRNTAVDALSHAVEGILSKKGDPMITALAMESIRAINSCIPALTCGTISESDRETLMYGSLTAGLVLAHTATTTVHAMGYSLTYDKGTPHGKANGLCMPGYLRFIERTNPAVIRSILDVMNLADVDAFEEVLVPLLGERITLTEGLIEKYCVPVMKLSNIPNSLVTPTVEDVKEIYRNM